MMTYPRLIFRGALMALLGFVLSGPVGFFIMSVLRPQPAWNSSAVFAANYHPVQDIPYYFGFLLIAGMLMTVAAHYLSVEPNDVRLKFRMLLALASTTVFCAMISFNYIMQTTFLHHLATNYDPENDRAIAMFSMANPASFCWSNEMWGYGLLGVATWLMAEYYERKSKTIKALLVTNGVVSLAGVFFTILSTRWFMTFAGLIAYFGWNVLMIVLMIFVLNFSTRKT